MAAAAILYFEYDIVQHLETLRMSIFNPLAILRLHLVVQAQAAKLCELKNTAKTASRRVRPTPTTTLPATGPVETMQNKTF